MNKTAHILEALPSLKFKVQIEGEDKERIGYLSGKLRTRFIHVVVGDKVTVFVPEQGEIVRIIRRL